MGRKFAVLVGALVLLVLAVPSGAAGQSSTWHRDNYGTGHERLVCAVSWGVWHCRYDTLPNYPEGARSNAYGEFNGSEEPINSENVWCPDWASDVCASAYQVVVGATVYQQPGQAGPLTIWEELIFTDGQGLAPMYMYLVGPPMAAVCPWYPTWEDALASDYECFFP